MSNEGLTDLSLIVSFVLVIGCVILYIIRLKNMYAGTAPGPWGIPIFGYSVFLSREAFRDFIKLSKTYGKTISVCIGLRHVTVLNSYKDIKEGFLKPGGIFHGRELHGTLRDDLSENKMVLGIDGKRRQLQRNLLMRAMRDFGLAHSRLEESIRMEVELVIEEIQNGCGGNVDFTPLMRSFSSNVVAHLMFGKRFSYKDKDAVQALDAVDELANTFGIVSPVFVIANHLRWLPDKLKGTNILKQTKAIIYNVIDKILNDHEKTFNENDMRDVIDIYIREQSTKDKSSSLHEEIVSKPYIRANSLLMFIAGTDTTASFFGLAFHILAGHTDIQKQFQEEIDHVVGSNLPSIRDLTQMPFTEAVILELMRFITTLPITHYHRVTEDTELNGFRLPKDSFVIANLWGANHDPDMWDEPETFRPQRFLDKDGIVAELRDQVLFFSLGKTRCLGEPIARMEIFILLVGILQKFSLSLPNGQNWKYKPDFFIPVMKIDKSILHVSERD